MNISIGPPINIIDQIPMSFWSKRVNEDFAAFVLYTLLELPSSFRHGISNSDPKMNEPDLIFGDIAFEVTFASERTKDSLIDRVRRGVYASSNMQDDTLGSIEYAIADKATKKYSYKDVHLCVICVLPLLTWVADRIGSVLEQFSKGATDRNEFFKRMKLTYIRNKRHRENRFCSIWLIFPDIFGGWTLQNIDTLENSRIQFDPLSRKFPSYTMKEIFEKLKVEDSSN